MTLGTQEVFETDLYDPEKFYKICIDDINKNAYSFLSNKNFVLPYIHNPKEKIIEHLLIADDFFDSLFQTLLENPEPVYKFFFSYPPKNSFIFALIDDYINNLYELKESEWYDDDDKSHGVLRYQYELFQKNRQKYNFQAFGQKIPGIHERILRFFEYSGFDFDTEIYTLRNLQLIHTYFSKNTLSQSETLFFYCMYGYIFSVILVSNLVPDSTHIVDFETLKQNYQEDNVFFFGCFLNHIVYCGKSLEKFDSAFEVFERRQLKNKFGEEYTLGHIELFQKSVIYKEYYLTGKITQTSLIQIFLDNADLFLAFKSIPYKEVFHFITQITDENSLLRIALFLQDRKGIKIKEKVLLFLLKNIVQTHVIIDTETLALSLKYFDLGLDNSQILSLPKELLLKVNDFSGDKKNLLSNILKNPNYLDDLEKEKVIQVLKKDLEFLDDTSDGKNELFDIIANMSELSIDELKAKILRVYIEYGLQENIAFNKRVLRNSKEDVTQNLEYLSLFLLTSIGKLHQKEEVLTEIFSLGGEDIKFVAFIFSRIVLPEDTPLPIFYELLGMVLSKKKYISQIVKGQECISLGELKEILDSKKLKTALTLSIQEVFGSENYELVSDALGLESGNYNIEKVYVVIEIGKKLSPEFKEDFILELENYSLDQLKNIQECIVFFKFIRIQPIHFYEYIASLSSSENIYILKKYITNRILDSVKNFSEFKIIIQTYLGDGNIYAVEEYINRLTKEDEVYEAHNPIDQKIIDIYQNGSENEKENLVVKIQVFVKTVISLMHPSQTTSTCNANFGKGSGSYSEVFGNYIFKKLLKNESETDNEYLSRILHLNMSEILEIKNISDINGYHELKCLYIAALKFNTSQNLVGFLVQLRELIGNITGELYLDLGELAKYYSHILEKELKKLKRSLDI